MGEGGRREEKKGMERREGEAKEIRWTRKGGEKKSRGREGVGW